MIEAISQWLQQIILLVLIATILDMLLPNTSIQRYVKFVMALLILLSMISPVINWIQKDLSVEKLYIKMMNIGNDEQNDWARLKDYSEKLMRENDREAHEFVKEQLSAMIAARVEERYELNVDEVRIDFEQKNVQEQSYPVISSVQLILDKDIRSAGKGDRNDRIQIEPVEPVTIDVSGRSLSDLSRTSPSPELTAAERKLLNEVVTDVAQTWDIERSRVRAKIKGNEEEG